MATETKTRITRTARVPLRMRDDQKSIIERAAAIEGSSVSDFVTRNAEAAARKTVREYDTILLSPDDSLAFARALMNPPAPNAALTRAFEHRDRLIGQT